MTAGTVAGPNPHAVDQACYYAMLHNFSDNRHHRQSKCKRRCLVTVALCDAKKLVPPTLCVHACKGRVAGASWHRLRLIAVALSAAKQVVPPALRIYVCKKWLERAHAIEHIVEIDHTDTRELLPQAVIAHSARHGCCGRRFGGCHRLDPGDPEKVCIQPICDDLKVGVRKALGKKDARAADSKAEDAAHRPALPDAPDLYHVHAAL
jgi:hypothetical protein